MLSSEDKGYGFVVFFFDTAFGNLSVFSPSLDDKPAF
jgi:hypothetical protein